MQNSSDISTEKQDERKNEIEDSLMMTIDYLRARLLSERSISRAAKERADELVKRAKELEEQLKVVTLQRKRAEKAALDVLSYLDSLGVNDISEAYESDSDEEESDCESNMGSKDDNNLGSLESKGNDKESSSSEDESTPSSSRSLSWKGRKESTRLLEKKCISSPIRSRTSLALINSLPRHRLGKSCRQIKRRELRSTFEESRHDPGKSDAQDSNAVESLNHCLDCLDFRSQESKKSPEKSGERGSRKNEIARSFQAQTQECDSSSSTHECGCNGEMERALLHQAQLIRCHEAQEKAQRDWEEKYGENNDSNEPGSHSDVTEERDENKAATPHPVEAGAYPGHEHDQKTGMETHNRGTKLSVTQFNSFKISPDADTGSSEKHNFSEVPPSTSSPDFAFTVTNNSQTLEHAARHLLHAGHVDPSPSGSAIYKSQPPQNLSGTSALVPHGEPAHPGSVLDALQEAKLLIKHHMNGLPKTGFSVVRAIETSVPANRDVDWLKLPDRCPGLFRVPNDPEGRTPNQSRLLGSGYPSEPTNSALNATAMAVQGHHYISSPMCSRLGLPSGYPFFTNPVLASELNISNGMPRFDRHYNANISDSRNANLLPHSSFPDDFPRTSSNQIMYSQFPRSEAGVPPSGYPSFQNHEVRPNTYR